LPYPKPPRTPDDSRMTASVLVVDDDPTFRALAIRLIGACGMTVVGEAEGVADGLSMAMQLKPSAALVDVGLPDGDGFALARELTALPWRPRVVLTSVEKNVGSPDGLRRSGAQAFVAKADLPGAPLARLLGGG
jgi:CheY-like chemotaxis protein